eukprot:TRINITY_DN285_c0_g1_i5.p1 TRINITY_DN285_c0_g1~~TRINITY_DN285_c0_g1_i5.p1  ORF type:complete len:110 (-),score=19.73 TRINITY_DN285_c0_g1_i5:199-528(-)
MCIRDRVSTQSTWGVLSKLVMSKQQVGLYNDEKQCVDLYIPRKCFATNKILHSGDKASVQINYAYVNEEGRYTGEHVTFAFSGYVRSKGQSDSGLINALAQAGHFPVQE